MQWRTWLNSWGLTSLRLTTPFGSAELKPNDNDQEAAWAMYVELLTRVTTHPMAASEGDEAAALASIHSLFASTRAVLKQHGREAREFSKLAILVLNQLLWPFTARWHRRQLAGAFDAAGQRAEFRHELAALQIELRHYAQALADLAGVEDITAIDEAQPMTTATPSHHYT